MFTTQICRCTLQATEGNPYVLHRLFTPCQHYHGIYVHLLLNCFFLSFLLQRLPFFPQLKPRMLCNFLRVFLICSGRPAKSSQKIPVHCKHLWLNCFQIINVWSQSSFVHDYVSLHFCQFGRPSHVYLLSFFKWYVIPLCTWPLLLLLIIAVPLLYLIVYILSVNKMNLCLIECS